MTLRNDLLPVFDDARQLIQDFGLRQSRVFKRRGVWDAGEIHLGTLENEDTEILPRPKVVQKDKNTVEVSRITPEYADGGYSIADLFPDREADVDFYYVIQGPAGVLDAFEVTDIESRKNFGYTLRMQRIGRAQPDEF